MSGTAKQNQACRPDYKYSDHFHQLVSLVWYLPLMADHTHRGRVLRNHKMGMVKKEGGGTKPDLGSEKHIKGGSRRRVLSPEEAEQKNSEIKVFNLLYAPWTIMIQWHTTAFFGGQFRKDELYFILFPPSLTGRFKGQISGMAQTAISSNNYHAQWHNIHSCPNMANNSTNRTRTVSITVSPFACQEFDHMDKVTTFVSLIFLSFNCLLCGKNIRIATVSCSGLLQYVQLEGCQLVKQTATVFPVHYIPLIRPASLHVRI